MKKAMIFVLLMVVFAGIVTGCSQGNDLDPNKSGMSGKQEGAGGTLNLFTWEGMFPQEVLDEFTTETGIKINYNNFDFDETMLAKLQAAKGGDYDLVIADDYIIEAVITEGLAQKLDTSKISNYANINPIYQGQFYDPNNEYTVPYGAGVQTIVYDPALVSIDIKGYADLFDSSLKDSVGTIANHRVINGLALKVMGESYNTEDISTIEAAGKKLIELAPNIRVIKDDALQDDLISGEVSVAVMYTSQVTTAKLVNPDLKVVFPSEGIGFGIMANFIPVNAPNAEAAYAFIDYILRPEVSAKCFEWLGYYCTNKSAEQFISDEFKEFLTLPADISSKEMEMIQTVSPEAEEAHTKIWTEFKAAAGQQ
ncbi:MAG: polyamine ABC transporter substrate-binding protein [Eubacteriales bacterium]|jgi:spermidine/putrescine transport system substrate-binding protein